MRVFALFVLLLCGHGQSALVTRHVTVRAPPVLAPAILASRHSDVIAKDSKSVGHFVAVRAPGLALSAMLAMPADALARQTSLSPLLWATIAGIMTGSIWRSVGALPQWLMPGVNFAKARLLRLGIILLIFY